MKETRIFYSPEADTQELPPEEAAHAIRVLRMKEGDELTLTDGKGTFYDAHITLASPKHCRLCIDRKWEDHRLWKGRINIAVAPTKNLDRMEWFVEKATEIGMDNLTLLACDNSERKVVKTERLEKITVAAIKQSHKAFKPEISPMIPFKNFVEQPLKGQKFIAHCYTPEECADAGGAPAEGRIQHLTGRNFLGDLLEADGEATVLIGPEGDFSLKEVEMAVKAGFTPISLGESRLRTETAALVAVHLMYLAKRR